MKSMRFSHLAALGLLTALVAAPAQANPIAAPGVSYTVGDATTRVETTPSGKQYGFEHVAETPDYLITMSGLLDPDPLISFLIGVTNFTDNAVLYTFTFSLPFSQPVLNGVGESSLSGLVSLIPTDTSMTSAGPTLLSVTLNGVDVGLGVGGDYDPLFDPGVYGPYNGGPVPLVGPYNQMTATLSFSLSARASAELNGSVLITPVPEPATMALLGLALCAAAARRRPRA